MKKGIIVLLIAVLVAGFAFADGTAGEAKFTGSATISYDYNLDSKATGIQNASALKYNFTFSFNSTDGASKGEGKLYAEIEANAKLELVAKNATKTAELTPKATLKITKANIIAGDITIDILGPDGFYNFASFYAENADGDAAEDRANENDLADLDLDKHGFRVIYKDFEVSFAFYHHVDAEAAEDAVWAFNEPENDLDPVLWVLESDPVPASTDKYTNLYAGFKTPAFALADGLTLTAGGNFYFQKTDDVDDAGIIVGGGAAVDYAPEDSKVSASFAADVEALIADSEVQLLPMEFSASAGYDFISAYAYFVTINKFDKDYFNLFAAKVEADYDVNESLNVGGYAEILLYQLLGESVPQFRFGANATYTAENFKLAATIDAWLKKVGDEYKLLGGKYFDGTKYPGLGVTVDLSSTKVIDNATVGVKWVDSDFAPNAQDEATALGKISAYCKVAF